MYTGHPAGPVLDTDAAPLAPRPATVWSFFNLTGSPFTPRDPRELPMELVVGRDVALERLLGRIATTPATRQVITGGSGIGKSTVAHAIVNAGYRAGYLAPPTSLTVGIGENASTVLAQLLRAVYSAVVAAAGPTHASADPLEAVRQFLRVRRMAATQAGAPDWLANEGIVPDLVADCVQFARGTLGAPGLILPVEFSLDLTEAEEGALAFALREARETLTLDGLHLVLVDRNGAWGRILTHGRELAQCIAPPEVLAPLPPEDVWALLWKRCYLLRRKAGQRVQLPVDGETVAELCAWFEGDLTGMLGALEQAATELVGFGTPLTAPMAAADVRAMLATRYRSELSRAIPVARHAEVDLLVGMGNGAFTPDDLGVLWSTSRADVLRVLTALERSGCARALRPRHADPLFALTPLAKVVAVRP